MKLKRKVHKEITRLSKLGDEQCENGYLEQGLELYYEALELVPEPKYDWEAATWLYVAIGDALFTGKEYEKAIRSLNAACMCPNGFQNPFILLRLGECYYELGNEDKAKEYFIQAYMLEEYEIFEGEEEKYKECVRSVVEGNS